MKIYFTNVGFVKFTIKRLLTAALHYLQQPAKDISMSLAFVSPEEIRQLNKQYRNVDSVTDVLSFPAVDNPKRAIFNVTEHALDGDYLATGKFNVGDVIICLDRAKEQAREYGHSLKRELCFLSLHGLLHLLGYDHIEPSDEQQMTSLQEQILRKMHIDRN